jgi:phage terminase large subunit-like protein
VAGKRRRGPLREGTIDHFRAWAGLLVLDTGETWKPEPFQLDVVDEILKGTPEVWLDVPEGNGKTTLMGGVALYHGDTTPDAMVPMAAASRDQTGILLNQASGFVRRTPGLERRFRVYEGYRRIKCLRTDGTIQVFAADDRTGDGVIFTLALLEELHRHPDLRLYRTWHGKIEKRGGQVVAISTAGEPGGEYENVKASVLKRGRLRRRGAHTVARTKELVLHQHALADGDDVHDLKRVKHANPFSGVTLAGLKRKHDSPTMLESHWARFVCGIPTRGDAAAITASEWTGLRKTKIPAGTEVLAGVDLGWKWDTTALVPLWMRDRERRVLGEPEVIVPPRDGTSTPPELIRAAARRIHERTPVHTWVVEDAAGAEQFIEWLQQEFPDARVVLWGTGNQPQSLAFDRWMEAVREHWLEHPHHELLTQHVLNAVAKPAGPDRYRFDRPRTTRQARGQDQRVIDCLDAAAAAHAVAVADDDPGPQIDISDYRISVL